MELFGELERRLLIDLICCIVAGFIIGAERESRGKDAGISTHTLVIIGAMLFTFMSSIVDPNSQSRIAAQIVTGIGFLGAGLIIKDGSSVRNLTTAASIWASGAVGMAFGYDFYVIGFMVAITVMLVPRIPHYNTMSPEAISSGIVKKVKQKAKSTKRKK